MKVLFHIYWHYAEKKGMQLFYMVVKSGAAVLSPVVFGALISELGEGCEDRWYLAGLVATIAAAAMVEIFFSYAQGCILAASGASMTRRLKNACYEDFQTRDAQEVASLPQGEWCQRISGDCECVAQCAGSLFPQWMEAAVAFFLSGVYILWQQPVFFLVMVPICAAFFWLDRLMAPKIQAQSKVMREAYYRESYGIYDIIELSPLLKVFRASRRFLGVFTGLTQATADASEATSRLSTRYSMWIQLVLQTSHILILVLALIIFWEGGIQAGGIVTFTMLATQLASMASSFATTGPIANKGEESAEALRKQFHILKTSRDRSEPDGGQETPCGHAEVELLHVGFSYHNSAEALLVDACMKVGAGDYIAILGTNGAGKSTLIKLILGMLPPNKGTLRNGFKRSAYVPQHSVIYHASFAQNISLNEEHPDLDSIHRLVHLCHLEKLVERLGGLDAPIAREKISGGESQRIGIARALYTRPDLLVVDEVTNNLDILGKELVFDILRQVSREGCAVLSVSHDIETMQDSCRSYILHHGRLHGIEADEPQQRVSEAIEFIKNNSYE